MQNLTEALLAVQVMPPGRLRRDAQPVCCQFPGVVKDRERGTFVHLDDMSRTGT